LILLMEEAGEAKELLYDYSNALLFEQRLMFDSARARFTAIAGNDNKALADVALYQLADLEFQRQDTTAAMEIIDRLIEEFPESYYQPYGIKTKADVLALDQSTVGKARELYTYLLENHPNYPFISYVRNRLRELEIDQKIG
jgi:outer membrane protein assembly factor BamD (BamD/ComL family)